MTQPLVAEIARRPALQRLAVLAAKPIADVFRAMPQRPETIDFDGAHGRLQWQKRRHLARALRAERFTHALVLPHSIKSALIPWLAGIPTRIGYLGEQRYGLINRRPTGKRTEARKQSMVGYFLGLAACLGSDTRNQTPPCLGVPTLTVEAAEVIAQQTRFSLRSYGVFAPGAEFGPSKQWPLEHWQGLIARLPAELSLVILGSQRDIAFGEAIAKAAKPGQSAINLCGQTTMAQAIALIAGAQWLLSNDSGLMHVAAALGKPQVAVFGSTDPEHSGPMNPLAIVHRLKLECSPCFKRHCPLGHHRCMQAIHPDVLAQDLRSLGRTETILSS